MKKLLAEFLFYPVVGAMSYMVYTQNFTYVGFIDVYFITILTFATVSIAITSLYFTAPLSGRTKKSLISSVESTNETLLGKLYISFKSLVIIILLILTQHVLLVIWYILATAAAITLMHYARKLSQTKGE